MSADAQPPVRDHRLSSFDVVLGGAILLVAAVYSSLWKPLLVATALAGALAGLHDRLAALLWKRRYLSAGVFTLGVVVLILVPLSFFVMVAVREAIDAFGWVRQMLRDGGMGRLIEPLPDGIERLLRPILDRLPTDVRDFSEGAGQAGRWLATVLQSWATTISQLTFALAMMLIALFFLLADGHQLVDWMTDASPLGPSRTRELLKGFRLAARSVIGANFITGLTQGAVAAVGYSIAGVPQPIFFAFLTLIGSFIPSVGTALVSLPLAALLAFTGKTGGAIFLVVWALLAVGLVDNLLRPMLIRGGMHVHGATVFFAIIGGIAAFGLAGLIVGPMALTLFFTMMRLRGGPKGP